MKKIKKTSLKKSDTILSHAHCICFAVCTMVWKEDYILIKRIVKNTTALTFEMHYS